VVITKTPFRVSFFGGGTDYPSWFEDHGGAVISTSIDKYCYITCRRLPQFFEHKHRIVYSTVETVNRLEEIKHPAVRACLEWKKIDRGLEIHHDGDLPARSGLGSSSSFTVGLLSALTALEGKIIDKKKLATDAIHIEQVKIGESVGSQDQISAAYGGLNRIDFFQDNTFAVNKIILPTARKRSLESSLLLFYTGLSRIASTIAVDQIKNFKNRERQLYRMRSMVDEALNILQDESSPIEDFGELLDESWKLKKTLSSQISNQKIDNIFEVALDAGAVGGKLLGAGGGGFLLLAAPAENHSRIRSALRNLICVPVKFENNGSQIVFYNPDGL
jgi:D-glycero-alpha-D-manno-heptose-7-phosphate kinase